jgi:hypothetical protein
MYLIDKVVRAKALQGPIGIDNSEVINLEIEKDVEKRNRYLAGLVRKQTSEVSEVDEDVDSNAEKDAGDKESRANEKLLKRLYKAAERDIQQDQGHEVAEVNSKNENVLGDLNKGLIEAHTKHEVHANTLNYESWVRTKEH